MKKTNSTITIEMKIGIFILWVVFTVGIMYGAIIMVIKLVYLEIHLKTSGEDGKMMSQGKNKLFGIFLLLWWVLHISKYIKGVHFK
jgi:hypothetical protein